MGLKEDKLKFLEDTLDYYAEDTSRRAWIEDKTTHSGYRCMYRTPDGRACALGRHIPDDAYKESIERRPLEEIIILQIFPESLVVFGEFFLQKIQQFHDNHKFWNANGLTDEGSSKYKELYHWITGGII